MKIGILGGGQLGRMFIQNALKYDDEFYTIDPAYDAPCHNISYFTQGNFKDYQTVLDFGKEIVRFSHFYLFIMGNVACAPFPSNKTFS